MSQYQHLTEQLSNHNHAQAHQVTVCVLFDLLMSAFENCHNENAVESIYIDFDSFLAWCSEQKIFFF
jgi:hypothetical protein